MRCTIVITARSYYVLLRQGVIVKSIVIVTGGCCEKCSTIMARSYCEIVITTMWILMCKYTSVT